MIIKQPTEDRRPRLRRLWQDTFGDSDAFLDAFFSAAFRPDRCLCAESEGRVLGAVYWFDCAWAGGKLAYIYALAVEEGCRGRGIGSGLMEQAHALLAGRGYGGVLLVPQEPGLVRMYEAMGYRLCTTIREFTCGSGDEAEQLRSVDRETYARLRRGYLPAGGVIQEGENLDFLQTQVRLFAGDGFLLAARKDGDALFVPELLGRQTAAPGILRALNCKTGTFRAPGRDKPFAMYRPLLAHGHPAPAYFAFAFD